MKCVKNWVETVAVPNVVVLRAAELALPGPLDTTWTENLAGALQAEAARGRLLASRTIKMEILDTHRILSSRRGKSPRRMNASGSRSRPIARARLCPTCSRFSMIGSNRKACRWGCRWISSTQCKPPATRLRYRCAIWSGWRPMRTDWSYPWSERENSSIDRWPILSRTSPHEQEGSYE